MDADLDAYLDGLLSRPEPERSMPPSERRTFSAGCLEVSGSRLLFCDAWETPTEGVSVPVAPGAYAIGVEVQVYGNEGRISRLVVARPDSHAQRGRCLGSFDVEVASAAVCDGDVMERFAEKHADEWDEWIERFVQFMDEERRMLGRFPCVLARTEVLHTSTGFGDGTYPVFELVNGAEVVGAEAIFLSPNQGYLDSGPGEGEDGPSGESRPLDRLPAAPE